MNYIITLNTYITTRFTKSLVSHSLCSCLIRVQLGSIKTQRLQVIKITQANIVSISSLTYKSVCTCIFPLMLLLFISMSYKHRLHTIFIQIIVAYKSKILQSHCIRLNEGENRLTPRGTTSKFQEKCHTMQMPVLIYYVQ